MYDVLTDATEMGSHGQVAADRGAGGKYSIPEEGWAEPIFIIRSAQTKYLAAFKSKMHSFTQTRV